jgi:hypothetical protein
MRSIGTWKWAILAPLVVALVGCTVRFDAEEQLARDEKRFTVTGPPEVRVTTFDGSIELRSWDRDEVLVEIERRGVDDEALESMEVRAEQQGNRVDVDVRRPARTRGFVGIGMHVSPRARLLVTVPRQVALLQARSGDGAIRADRLGGRIELRTGDGSVRVEEIEGHLQVDTGDGSITIADVDGEVTLATRDGGINVSGRLAGLRAKTGDGSITVRAEAGSVVDQEWSLSTGDGSVVVYLPGGFNAEVDAETRDGRVRSDVDLGDTREQSRRRRSVRGRIGEGGSVLRIRTGDGSISLRSW